MDGEKQLRDARDEYADFLERLVECPVCYERPQDHVLMCMRGHHVCRRCRNLLLDCPICRKGFSSMRNFVAEELCTGLPKNATSTREPPADGPIELPPNEGLAVATRGCRIGFCGKNVPPEEVYRHVRACHSGHLIEVDVLDGSSCSKTWKLKYDQNMLYDYALYAEGLGLFFVNLYINQAGHLLVDLQVAENHKDDKLHYQISVYVPGKRAPAIQHGTVQDGSISINKFSHACQFRRRLFACYFEEPDFVIRKDSFMLPFTVSLFIYE